jgi:serine/threonine-protein kinase
VAEAHASLGHISMRYDWDWAAAERGYRRALELNPNYATAQHWYAIYLTITGRHDEAIEESRRARQLDPLSPIIDLFLGAHLFFARRYDEAIAHCLRITEAEPGFLLAYTFLGQAYAHVGKHEEARAALRTASGLSGEKEAASLLLQLGHFSALAGRPQEARAALAELERLAAREFVNPFEIAKIHLALGETDEAFAWLEKAYVERVSDLIFLNVTPEFDSVRADPRFRHLLERIGPPS